MTTGSEFGGAIGRLYADSKESWSTQAPRAPEGAPDVIFIVLDDVGFSDLGCYGSEIATPHMDRLGTAGLHYNNFHVTAMCSPTRACVLTGRNAHSVGMGVISEWAGGFPGYQGHISDRAATIAEILRDNGYATMGVGKWHLTPMKDVNAAGPYGNWPLGRGFDRWYGFQGAFTDQWNPELYQDNQPIERPPREGYHLSEDLVDRSIAYVDNQIAAAPDKPYFLYLAFGACHWPHHVPPEFIARYRGRYGVGWDTIRQQRYARQKEIGVIPANTLLPPPNPGVPAWKDLSDDERRFCERSQELYAGFVEHTDQQIGRLLDFLEARGRIDNTLIVLLSDNGASPEGGPLGIVALNARKHLYHGPESPQERRDALDMLGGKTTYPHYAFGWAQASNTPLQWYKMNTYGGGVRAPLLVHWPAGIKVPGLRTQYHHAIDLLPTVLDILGRQAPAAYRGVPQIPVQGTSLRYSFNEPEAPTHKQTQFFELNGDRAIWQRGWKAVTHHKAGDDFEADRWALFHLDEDFSECRDLAQQHPVKLQELIALWWYEAATLGALPLDDRWAARSNVARGTAFRRTYTFYPGLERVDRIKAPDMSGRAYSIVADVEIPPAGAQGVLLAFGSSLAGYVLYVQDSRVVHEYVFSGRVKHVVRADRPLASGRHELRYTFSKQGAEPGIGALFIDDVPVGTAEVPRTWPNRAVQGGLTCGRDAGLEVSDAYRGPFPFTGLLHRVVVEIGDEVKTEGADPALAVWPPPHMR
jgi:arylsulfatase A-like enzyme